MYRFTKPQVGILREWSPAQRYWLQSWLELLHEFSASFFRLRPVPLSALAAELVDLLSLWKRGSVAVHAVEEVRIELLQLVRDDPLLALFWRGERNALLAALGNKLDKDLPLTAWSASQLSSTSFAKVYRARLIDELSRAVAEEGTVDFKRVRGLSERLIAELLWSGYSDTHLFKRAMRTLQETSAPGDQIEQALHDFNGDEKEFECHFRIDGLRQNLPETFDFVGVDFFSAPIITPSSDKPVALEDEFFGNSIQARFAKVKVTALDPYAAADQAGIILRRAMDALVFTAPLQGPLVSKAAYARSGGWRVWIDLLDTAVFGLLSKGTERFPRFQKLFRSLVETGMDQTPALDAIHIALHWYTSALGSAALDLERTFLSLWIGLEYLVAGHGRVEYSDPSGIILPIKRFLPKVMALYLPAQLLQDLSSYIYRLVENGDVTEQGALVDRLPRQSRRVSEVEILGHLQDTTWVEELRRQMPQDELLRQRLSYLRSEIGTVSSLLRLAAHHANRTERDIAHIYRVRNNIAHGGAFGRKLPLLRYGIRIAHDYLSTLIENLLFHTSRDRGLAMRDVLMSCETTFDHFQCHGAKTGGATLETLIDYRCLFIEAGGTREGQGYE